MNKEKNFLNKIMFMIDNGYVNNKKIHMIALNPNTIIEDSLLGNLKNQAEKLKGQCKAYELDG